MPEQMSENGLHVIRDFRASRDVPVGGEVVDGVQQLERGEVLGVINNTGVDTQMVLRAAAEDPQLAPVRDALVTWTTGHGGWNNGMSRAGGLFDRDRFVRPFSVFDKMEVAELASKDDIVASFLDSSEAMAFSRMEIEADDEDEMDIWAQIMQDIDIDSRMREIWRDNNIYSQVYVAVWFGTKSYKVRGKSSNGTKRKKQFANLTVPLGITTLDPLKVIPVGNFLFQQETLTYYANPTEKDVIDSWLLGDDDSGADEIIRRLIVDKFEPDYRDRKEIGNLGIDPNRLYVLNPKYVWRHTATKPGYQRFAPIRMESVFELLDLKRQLKARDRALLIGATNYIILITKGSDKEPAKQYEITNLQMTARTLSKVPILVGDHRLHVEIITPKNEGVLDAETYQSLNLAIEDRLFGKFLTTHAGRDDSLKLARVVARGLESRRLMQKKSFMQKVIFPTYELNDSLTAEPDFVFFPHRIALDFDPSLATYLLDLRDRGDLSRSSVLSEIDYDEASEAGKREMEKDKYDAIFTAPANTLQPGTPGIPGVPKAAPLQVPPGGRPSTPRPGAPNSPKRAGRAQGGNHGKGGNGNVGRGAGQAAKPGHPGKGIKSKPQITQKSRNTPGATDNT